MTTFAELVEEVNFTLHSYTGVKEQVTYLASEFTDTDLTANVANGKRVSQGLVEIGDELVDVERVDQDVITIFPFGRGQQQSTAQLHPMNTKVVNDPLFPQVTIFRDLKQVVDMIHPDLFQVKSTEIVFNPARFGYELPSDVDRVLEVTASHPGPERTWPQVRGWRLVKNSGEFATGKALEVRAFITPGEKFRVIYAASFGAPSSTDDTLADVGMEESARDVVVYGTCHRLIQGLEASRLHMYAVEQMARQEAVQPGAMTDYARQLYALFTQRKMEERKRLLTLHPQQPHWTR